MPLIFFSLSQVKVKIHQIGLFGECIPLSQGRRLYGYSSDSEVKRALDEERLEEERLSEFINGVCVGGGGNSGSGGGADGQLETK